MCKILNKRPYVLDKLVPANIALSDKNMLEDKFKELLKSYKYLEFLSGVANFEGHEQFDYIKIYVLRHIERVLETYNKLSSDSIVRNNVEALDYKF